MRQHLNAYGRTDVTFTKIDDETYFMDFSMNQPPLPLKRVADKDGVITLRAGG